MCIRLLVVMACSLALLPLGAAAQTVGGGVKGGLALGDVPKFLDETDEEPGVDSSLRIGYAVRGFLAIRFNGGFSLQPEVLFTQKGVKLDIREDGERADIKYKGDYLDVPVLARYTFGKGVRGYLFGAPSFDIMLNAKTSVSFPGQSEEEDISTDVEDFEVAVVFGGGIELGPILLEARWSEGLTNIAAEEIETATKTRTYLVLFGFFSSGFPPCAPGPEPCGSSPTRLLHFLAART
jgi:hypothetical protein